MRRHGSVGFLRRSGVALLVIVGWEVPRCGSAHGQAFETLDVALRVARDVNHGTFHDFWDPGLGIEGSVGFPFYRGAFRFGIQQFHHDAIGNAVGFRSRFFHAGWDAGVPLAARLTWRSGVEAGLYHIWFDPDTIPEFSRSESEFGVGGRSGLEYAFGGRWLLGASAQYQLVLTDQRIHRLMIGLSLGYRFASPRWLRDFLR